VPDAGDEEGASLNEGFDYPDSGGGAGYYPSSQVVSGADDWDADFPPPPDLFPSDWVSPQYGHTVSDLHLYAGNVAVQESDDSFNNSDPNGAPEADRATQMDGSIEQGKAVVVDKAEEEPQLLKEPEAISPDEHRPQIGIAESVSLDHAQPVENSEPNPKIPPQLSRSDEIEELVANTQNYLVSPIQGGEGTAVHMITVVLRSTGDKTRDVLRMRSIHGTAMSFPGNDRFAFHVFEKGHGYLVEFPNFTTGLCPDLLSKLRLLAGSENVRVEPIMFQ
jgi:hypothetical protein